MAVSLVCSSFNYVFVYYVLHNSKSKTYLSGYKKFMKSKLFSITKKDFRIEYFSGTGAGGQYRNKHQNCVRLFHADSGVCVTGQSQRNRQANLREAFNNLTKNPKFKVWFNGKLQEVLTGKTLESKVEEMMAPENLKVEIMENGKFIVEE